MRKEEALANSGSDKDVIGVAYVIVLPVNSNSVWLPLPHPVHEDVKQS